MRTRSHTCTDGLFSDGLLSDGLFLHECTCGFHLRLEEGEQKQEDDRLKKARRIKKEGKSGQKEEPSGATALSRLSEQRANRWV